jgi:hypothetical protein
MLKSIDHTTSSEMRRTNRGRRRTPRLPPTNLKGVSTYYRKRGYSPDPLLEDKEDADLTFVKPLPDGRRIHVRVKEGREYIHGEEHIDRVDPNRDPIGHLVGDVLIDGVPHHKFKILKRKKS